MEQVVQEFKEKTLLKNQFNEINFITKHEDSDWTFMRIENQDVFYNEETEEYVWKNPYYTWRFKEKYSFIPCKIIEWINECDSLANLQELIDLTNQRITILQ